MSRRPGLELRKILILHAAWLKANGYPEQQAQSCKLQAPSQAASLTRKNYNVIESYKLKDKKL